MCSHDSRKTGTVPEGVQQTVEMVGGLLGHETSSKSVGQNL